MPHYLNSSYILRLCCIVFLRQVSLWIPALFVVVCAFLVVVPIYVAPYEVGMGVLITLIGIPFYYVGVVWQNKPKWVQQAIGGYSHQPSFLCLILNILIFLYRLGDLHLPEDVFVCQGGEEGLNYMHNHQKRKPKITLKITEVTCLLLLSKFMLSLRTFDVRPIQSELRILNTKNTKITTKASHRLQN